MTNWLEGIKKISLNTEPYIHGFDPKDSGFTNHIVFVRESGVTESSTGSPTGVIYLNGIKYGDGLDTYINKVTYLNKDDDEHPYSLEFNYIDGNKQTFYVNIGDIENIYSILSGVSGNVGDLYERMDNAETNINIISGDIENIYGALDNTIMSASYVPYSSSTSGSLIALYMMNGDINYISINDIDYIIENYQPIVDNGLLTENNTVSGAINEIYNIALDNQENIFYLYQSLSGMSGCCEDIDELKRQVSGLNTVLNTAYINATYSANTLNLIRVNGEITSLVIGGEGSGCHCHCCCPIIEIMKDGDSWIQKLGRRVDALENYIYNHSGDITYINYCIDDLEKRVRTLENEVDLDNDMIIDYTTVPVSSWSLSESSVYAGIEKHKSGFPYVKVTTDDGAGCPFPYISIALRNHDEDMFMELFADTDGDITLEDFFITEEDFLIARITKTNGKIVTLNNFNSLQSYFEDFTHLIKYATVTLKNGNILNFESVDSVFNRSKYIQDKLDSIDINYDSFSCMNVISSQNVTMIEDLDEAIAYIISHTDALYSGKIQLAFVLNKTDYSHH